MNNNILIFGGAILFAIIWYLLMHPLSERLAKYIEEKWKEHK